MDDKSVDNSSSTEADSLGNIVQVVGAVVDVSFPATF